jgi:signal transduction histidine kinase
LDRHRIHEALVNLLQNALDASVEGTEVRLSAFLNQNNVQIAVEDQGGGVPPEYLDRIFLPFFTTKPRGTGLGLATTRRIVNEHEGDLQVVNSVGKGARFILTIPVLR